MSDEGIDPKPKLESECVKHYGDLWNEYEACKKRVADGNGHCTGTYYVYSWWNHKWPLLLPLIS